jgi:hypothetical protein
MTPSCNVMQTEFKNGILHACCPDLCGLKLEECMGCLDDLYQAVTHHGATRLLIDSTAIVKQLPIMDLYEIGRRVAETHQTHPLSIAIVSHRGAVYPDRFFQTVVSNRGVNLLVFVEDFDAAAAWLSAQPGP